MATTTNINSWVNTQHQITDYNKLHNSMLQKGQYDNNLDIHGYPARANIVDGKIYDTNSIINRQTNVITISIVAVTTFFVMSIYLVYYK